MPFALPLCIALANLQTRKLIIILELIMKKLFLTTTCVLAISGISSAQAGFQWTAPQTMQPEMNVTAPKIVMDGAQVSESMVEAVELPNILTDMPDNGAMSEAPVTETDVKSEQQIFSGESIETEEVVEEKIQWPTQVIGETAPMASETASLAMPQELMMPKQDQMTVMPTPVTTGSRYDVIEGFGRDLPLVMAVRQIVPEGYGYAFAEGTPLNETVSWEGGRAWDQVLYEVLNPLGYKAKVNNKLVSVMPISVARLSAAATYVDQPTAVTPAPVVKAQAQAPAFELVAPTVAPVAVPTPAASLPNGLLQTVAYQSNTMTSSVWTAGRDMTLRQILEKWSNRAGVDMYWSSEFDYPVSSAVNIQGTFEEAVQTLLKGLADAQPKPLGRLHPNLPNGPAVLVIETRQVLD